MVRISETVEHFDVLIVGAGISGVGGAYHLTQQCPGTSFVVLEAQESFGGTWLTHRYPGIRSDSDLYTFGYRFKPWTGAPIATAAEILSYMGEVIEENDLARHIRYRHRIDCGALVERRQPAGRSRPPAPTPARRVRFTANFLWMCQGYYRHSEGYTPEWPGMDDFKGRIVHPQTWPEDLDYKGKNVVVIGSGATAATLHPGDRRRLRATSPCCSARRPSSAPAATRTSSPTSCASSRSTRPGSTRSCAARSCTIRPSSPGAAFAEPEAVKQELLAGVRAYLGPDYDIETHFTPSYRPWRQRIAFVPDGDLFKGIAAGKASVVTDEIERFTETGILLKSGQRARGRHHRHRHRLQPQRAGRHRLHHRRQAARLRRHRHLSRHDVHRRAQPGLGVRLFPRELDLARRPGRRLRLPAAQPHEGEGRAARGARAAARGQRTCRCCRGSTRRTSIRAT